MHIFRRILTVLLPYRLKMDLLGAGGAGRSEALPQDQSGAGLGLDGAGRTARGGRKILFRDWRGGEGTGFGVFGAGLFFYFFLSQKKLMTLSPMLAHTRACALQQRQLYIYQHLHLTRARSG